MRLYRLTRFSDLQFTENGIFVNPKSFESNSDSTIPKGSWSFWFDKPYQSLVDFDCIVSADFEPVQSGTMTFGIKEGYDYVTYELPEYVTNNKIKIQSIIFNSIHVIENYVGKTFKSFMLNRVTQDEWNSMYSDTFPHLNENSRYYYGSGRGAVLDSFVEILSNTSYVFYHTSTFIEKPDDVDSRDYPMISLDLFVKKYPSVPFQTTDDITYVSYGYTNEVNRYKTYTYY